MAAASRRSRMSRKIPSTAGLPPNTVALALTSTGTVVPSARSSFSSRLRGPQQFQFAAARSPFGVWRQKLRVRFRPTLFAFCGIKLGFRLAYDLLLGDAQHLAGFVVGFENETGFGVDHQNGVIRRVNQVMVLLFGIPDLLQHGGREANPDQQQQSARQDADQGQHPVDPASTLA